jgi:hypothetical protein
MDTYDGVVVGTRNPGFGGGGGGGGYRCVFPPLTSGDR